MDHPLQLQNPSNHLKSRKVQQQQRVGTEVRHHRKPESKQRPTIWLPQCPPITSSPPVRLLPSALRHRRQKSYSRGYVCEGRGGTGEKEATFPWIRTHYDHQVGKLFAALFFANVQTRSVPSVSLISRLFSVVFSTAIPPRNVIPQPE